jgi:hypothetical protein
MPSLNIIFHINFMVNMIYRNVMVKLVINVNLMLIIYLNIYIKYLYLPEYERRGSFKSNAYVYYGTNCIFLFINIYDIQFL